MKTKIIYWWIFNVIKISLQCTNINKFVIEYYSILKNVSSFIGFTCNEDQHTIALLKEFNALNISSAFKTLTERPKLKHAAVTSYHTLGILIDLQCLRESDVVGALFEASKFRMYDVLRKWLIIGPTLRKVISAVDTESLGVDTDVVIAIPARRYRNNDGQRAYNLYDVYNPDKFKNGKLNVTFYGSWHYARGFNISVTQDRIARRANLHNMTFVASYLINQQPKGMELTKYLSVEKHLSHDALAKIGYKILLYLSEMHNFSLINVRAGNYKPEDAKIGTIMRGLHNNTLDFSGSALAISPIRLDYGRFVWQFMEFRTCFIMLNPPARSVDASVVFEPFEGQVWGIFFSLSLLMTMFLWILLNREELQKKMSVDFIETLCLVAGVLCQQGNKEKIDRFSTRFVFLILLFFSVICFNFYTAVIVSLRIRGSTLKINNSLSELSKLTSSLNFKLASEPMMYFYLFMLRKDWETQSMYNNSWSKIPEPKKFIVPEEGVKKIRQGYFAYNTHPHVSYPLIEKSFNNKEICELKEVNLVKNQNGFFVRLNSSLVETWKIGVAKIVQVGIRTRQVLHHSSRRPICRLDDWSATSVEFFEAAYMFLILMYGMLWSIFIFTIERFVKRRGFRAVRKLFNFSEIEQKIGNQEMYAQQMI